MYLRNTGIIQDKHRDVLRAASQEIIDLITGSSVNIPNLAGLTMVEVDNTMGDYIDTWTNGHHYRILPLDNTQNNI